MNALHLRLVPPIQQPARWCVVSVGVRPIRITWTWERAVAESWAEAFGGSVMDAVEASRITGAPLAARPYDQPAEIGLDPPVARCACGDVADGHDGLCEPCTERRAGRSE